MNPTVLGVIGPGFLFRVPTLSSTPTSLNLKAQVLNLFRVPTVMRQRVALERVVSMGLALPPDQDCERASFTC